MVKLKFLIFVVLKAARKISMINLNNCSHTVLIAIELIKIVNLIKLLGTWRINKIHSGC